jgi:hypothetical protein
MTGRRTPHPEESAMAGAFLRGLRDRVERDPHGKIVLPTGRVDAVDVGRVLAALDRAREATEDR